MRWLALAITMVMLLGARATAAPHPAIDGKACLECHPDVHHGEFARRPDGGDCKGCHLTIAWSPSTFDAAKHATTAYALDGKHVATPCSGCHPGARPRTSFQVAQSECLDCHQNPHGQQFAAQQANGGCAECHTTTAWKQWKVDHRSWPLAGAHQRMPCAGCHPGKGIDAPIAAFRGVPRACIGCHADLHAGQFATAPQKACTACHDTERWKTPRFDHAKTRYALEGVHVGMSCDTCHRTVKLRNGDVARSWRLGYAECKDCHANPHPKVAIDCRGCHSATTWRPSADGGRGFDHDATGFQLRATHAKASCAKCHDGKPKPAGQPRATNSTCQSCHPDPHMGHMAGQCFECHTAVAWSDVSMFEQHRRTRMPLTGKHAVIECGACHRRQSERPFRDLPTDCYGCHGKKYQALADHNGTVGERYPRDCGRCHVTSAWQPAIDPDAVARLGSTQHDRSFVTSSGSHRSASCDACHIGGQRTRLVRCDGCHTQATLRTQHRSPVTPIASACLRCHPRGARR